MTNADLEKFTGLFYFPRSLLDVRLTEDGLITTMPGVPAGYEIRSRRLGDNQFQLIGGLADGAVTSFVFDEAGEVVAMQAGPMQIPRVPSAENLAISGLFAAPKWTLSAEKQRAFDTLLATVETYNGDWLNYDLPYPKYQFLQYATAQDRFIFHGSNNQTIAEFAPIRKSVELNDLNGRGNHQAVYGTHEALWSMFFAIVDRVQLKGTISNGVAYFYNEDGDRLPLFMFSVNQEQLADRPFCDGALYILPRNSFEQVPLWEGVLSNEWVSTQPVKPFAKLRLSPADFPFLDDVEGHDDGPILRMQALARELEEAAISAEFQSDRFILVVANSFDMDSYVDLQRAFMPGVEYAVEVQSEGIQLTISAIPPAYRHSLETGFASLLA